MPDTFDCRRCGTMREQRQPEPFYCSACDGGLLAAYRELQQMIIKAGLADDYEYDWPEFDVACARIKELEAE